MCCQHHCVGQPVPGCLDKCDQYSTATVTASSQLPIIFSHYSYIDIRHFLSANADVAAATVCTISLKGCLLNAANTVLRRSSCERNEWQMAIAASSLHGRATITVAIPLNLRTSQWKPSPASLTACPRKRRHVIPLCDFFYSITSCLL